ncbi:dephospho-CoA kinase [Flavobacterium sp. J372]|uniref:dephospho-CoA kinase n=1 Tax=Flavobacterium sp. J372 TaxID=2898436 RepID=UPI0021513FFD|nr:dephospho-CoA kinase [Flavobacterium sp. J372]MCR5862206.1 dephospho-CoA kinase [Flavobacterium sp. J372]
MTNIIGLTGGIGSGKSTIAEYFASLGVPVYIADDEAKKILYTPEVSSEIKKAFGDAALTNGIPDRKKIAQIVFNDPEKLKILNSIIHPKVSMHFKDWVHNNSSAKFVIKEAAILFESGSYKDCDEIILVTAPVEERILRVMKRDNITRHQVFERMKNQWSDDQKAVLSNYIIDNTELDSAKAQAYSIFKHLTSKDLQGC